MLEEDLSKVTGIPTFTLKRLINESQVILCNNILENYMNGQKQQSVDIGIGKLNIVIDSDQISYKFIPAADFEKQIVSTLTTKQSPLIKRAEFSLQDKISRVYKDLLNG